MLNGKELIVVVDKSSNVQGEQHYGAILLYTHSKSTAKDFLRETVKKGSERIGGIMWFPTHGRYAIIDIPAAPHSLSTLGCQMDFKISNSFVALRRSFIQDVEFGPESYALNA